MKKSIRTLLSYSAVSVITIGIVVLAFEGLFKMLDRGVYHPPLSLNIKLHSPNSTFKVPLKYDVRARSNETVDGDNFVIRTGASRDILGSQECQTSADVIFAIGSSTTEQKLITQGHRWVDVLNQDGGDSQAYCVRNYGYGGVNLRHINDSLYFLLSQQKPRAVILMSNATDVGQLMRYGGYDTGTNHFSKQRVILDGRVSTQEQGAMPGMRFLWSKLTKNSASVATPLALEGVDKAAAIDVYLEQVKALHAQAIGHDIPFIYVQEPRILDLSLLEPERAERLASHYEKSGVAYADMSALHAAFTDAVRTHIATSGQGCFVETTMLNDPTYLYDEGHLNRKGSKRLAALIAPYLSDLSACQGL